MPMTSSYSSSLVHSFSDPKCCFLLWKIWIPTLLKWDESQESINRKSCWFVSVTVFFQSTNWIWFCCFNMFRPKCCLIHVMNREHWIVEMTVWWVLQINPKMTLFENQGMKSFSDCKDSTTVYFSATRSDESLLTAVAVLSNLAWEPKLVQLKWWDFTRMGLKPDFAANLLFLQPTFEFFYMMWWFIYIMCLSSKMHIIC